MGNRHEAYLHPKSIADGEDAQYLDGSALPLVAMVSLFQPSREKRYA